MFERREVGLSKQSLRPDKRHSGGAPVPSLLTRGTAAHLAAADVTRLQRAVGNRGITALLSRQPIVSISPIPVQRCGEPGCDCVEDRTAPDIEVQRDDKTPAAPGSGSAAPPVVAPPPTPTGTVVPYVVRDPSIGVGGPLVADLSALKAALLNRKDTGQWSLMLSIHGSGDRLAAQAPPDWTLNAVFYEAAIKQLFSDKAFTEWRDQYGPQRVVLVACQVSQAFNQLVVDTLSRGGKGLSAGGLGPGCKPIATTQSILFRQLGEGRVDVQTARAQYDALNPNDKAIFESMLRNSQ